MQSVKRELHARLQCLDQVPTRNKITRCVNNVCVCVLNPCTQLCSARLLVSWLHSPPTLDHHDLLSEQHLMALVIETEPEMGMGQLTSRAQQGQLLDTTEKLTE